MVQMINSGSLDAKKGAMKQTVAFPEPESTKRSVVKLEIEEEEEEEEEEERWPPSKRCKHPAPFQQLIVVADYESERAAFRVTKDESLSPSDVLNDIRGVGINENVRTQKQHSDQYAVLKRLKNEKDVCVA